MCDKCFMPKFEFYKFRVSMVVDETILKSEALPPPKKKKILSEIYSHYVYLMIGIAIIH